MVREKIRTVYKLIKGILNKILYLYFRRKIRKQWKRTFGAASTGFEKMLLEWATVITKEIVDGSRICSEPQLKSKDIAFAFNMLEEQPDGAWTHSNPQTIWKMPEDSQTLYYPEGTGIMVKDGTVWHNMN